MHKHMKNLTIDIGNTLAKYAIFENESLVSKGSFGDNICKGINILLEKNNGIENCIISAVGKINIEEIEKFSKKFKSFIIADYKTKIPCINRYKTPETLGFDRIAACIGAFFLSEKKNCLVIDSGTALTFDIINSESEYLGGLISPGIEMRFKALNKFTNSLPLCSKRDIIPLYGQSTKESIVGGVTQGIINEIDAYIFSIKEKYADLKVFLTGGDAFFFDKRLKNSIFVQPNLIYYGLNQILIYNAKNE